MAGESPYDAWKQMTAGAQANVDNMGPIYQAQGLAGVLAQNLQRQGGEQNNMMAQQMQANPMAGVQGMQMLDQRALDQSMIQKNEGAGALGQANASNTNALTALINSGFKGVEGLEGLDGIERAYALMSQDSGKVRDYRDRSQFKSGWKPERLDQYRRQDAKELEGISVLENLENQFPNYDPTEALSVMKMLTMFVKSFDEGIVREDDVRNIRAATGTGIDELITMATQYWKEGTAFPEKTGRRLMSALKDSVSERQLNLVHAANRHEAFGDSVGWSEAARNTAIPNRKATSKLRKKQDTRANRLKGARRKNGELWAQEPSTGDWVTINPKTGAWEE